MTKREVQGYIFKECSMMLRTRLARMGAHSHDDPHINTTAMKHALAMQTRSFGEPLSRKKGKKCGRQDHRGRWCQGGQGPPHALALIRRLR